MTFRKFPYYCVLFIVTLSALFLSCNNLLLEKKNADFSVQITMPPAYSTTAGSDPVTGGDISTEAPAEKWNLIAWVEEAGNPEFLSVKEMEASSGEIKKINFEKIDVNLKVRVCMTLATEGKVIYKGESKWFVTQPGTNKISLELVKVPVDALEPVIKNQSKEVYITEDNETVNLFIEAYSPDGGTLSFIWEKKISSDEWERVSISQSVEENDVQDGDKQIRLFKSKITVSEKGTYQCIVLNTNIDATGNITAKKTSSLIEVHFVEGSLKSFEVEGYMVFGSGNKDNLKVYAIYSNNGEDNRVPITDLDELEIVSEDTDSIGYVPYTVEYNDFTKDLKIPTKYKLEANNISLESYFNDTSVSYSSKDKLSVPRYATLSCSYELDNISLKLIDENGNENQIKTINEYYRATITNSSNISEGDYCETTGKFEYKVILNSNNDWFVCEEDNNKEFYVEVCPWEIKFTEINGTNGNPVSVENLKIDTTYMLSVANDAWENHGLQVKFNGSGVFEEGGCYYFAKLEGNAETTIIAIAEFDETIIELTRIDVEAGNTEEEFVCDYIFEIGDSDDSPNSVENASYENGVITVNNPDSSGSVWDYYARATTKKDDGSVIFGEGNYKISLDMKASAPTVVGIQAAYADMFFTVGTEWATYEFETGYIDVVSSNEDGYDKNGITIGSALTEKLYFNNVNVEQVANDNLPALVFNVTKQGIEKHLSNIGNNVEIDSDNKVTNGIINVSRAVDSTGYDITINTPIVSEESKSHDKDGKVQYYDNDVSLQLRGYANKGMNKVSVNVIPLNSSSFYTSILSQPFSKKTLSWNNSPVVINEETPLYDYFPSYEETDVVTVDVLARSTSNTSSESTSFSIENFKIETIKPVEEKNFNKTILVQEGNNGPWKEFNNDNDNDKKIQIEKSGNIQIIMLDKYLWDDGIFPTNGWEKITRIYYIEGIETDSYGDFISFGDSISFPITLSLTDDFTVQIEEVESDSGETSGGTENGESGDPIATIISEEVNGLQYVSINDIEGMYIKDEEGLAIYRDMINGDLEEAITFKYNSGNSSKTFSSGTSHYLNGYLMNDITVSDWVPIGTSNKPFTGSFDGQGNTITINSIAEDSEYVGVFGCVGNQTAEGTIISNLVVKGTAEGITTSKRYSGGVVAFSKGVTIKNCVNKMQIINSYSDTNGITDFGVGGIVGFVQYETVIDSCVNFSNLVAKSSVGGIVGKAYHGTWYSLYLTIKKCVNLGSIMSYSTGAYVSGILGYSYIPLIIQDSINIGERTYYDPSSVSYNDSGFVFAKGQEDSSKPNHTVAISNCINAGSYPNGQVTSNSAFISEIQDSPVNGEYTNLYYDSDKWVQEFNGSISNITPGDSTKSGITGKTTAEICNLTQNDLSSNWSIGDTNRYPLPDLSNVFTQAGGSDNTIWDEIVTAANTSGTN